MFIKILILCLGISFAKDYCQPGDKECWPTTDDIQSLYDSLDPTIPRVLNWSGGTNPRIAAVPLGSPGD